MPRVCGRASLIGLPGKTRASRERRPLHKFKNSGDILYCTYGNLRVYRLYRAVRPVVVREANRPRRPPPPRRPAAAGGVGGNPDADWVRGSRPPDGIRRLHAHQIAGEVCERLEALCHAAPRLAPRRAGHRCWRACATRLGWPATTRTALSTAMPSCCTRLPVAPRRSTSGCGHGCGGAAAGNSRLATGRGR